MFILPNLPGIQIFFQTVLREEAPNQRPEIPGKLSSQRKREPDQPWKGSEWQGQKEMTILWTPAADPALGTGDPVVEGEGKAKA